MKDTRYRVVKPGPWSFGVVAVAVALVVAAFAFHVPEAGKLASAVIAIVGAFFAVGPLREREP